jgi:DNA polymerase-3 subunit alpha
LLAYQTAYLKANYPWHFAAALLTIEAQNTDKLALYLGECRDRGIPVLPPDINQSQLRFTVEPDKGVRFGLTAIKNVGEGAIESLLAVRQKQGRIKSLSALCEDLDLRLVNKRVFESLIKAGAFDSLGAELHLSSRELRPRLLAAVDAACEYGARLQDDRERGQGALFGDFEASSAATGNGNGATSLAGAAPWTETEQLAFEKETLGLYWSGHPVDRYAAALKEYGAKTVGDLADVQGSSDAESWGPGGRKPIEPDTAIGGIVAACRQLKTRKGDRMAVFTLEDSVGGVEVVVFPEAYQRAAALIETGTPELVCGNLERDEETVRILASDIAPLDSVRERIAREVAIHLKKPADRGTLETLGEIFSRHRGDRKISFEVETGEEPNRIRVKVDVSSQIRVRPSPALISDIEQVVGAGAVELR